MRKALVWTLAIFLTAAVASYGLVCCCQAASVQETGLAKKSAPAHHCCPEHKSTDKTRRPCPMVSPGEAPQLSGVTAPVLLKVFLTADLSGVQFLNVLTNR